jgi:hypothetical protein
MSLAYDTDTTPEYATRTELHYLLRVSMAKIALAIREGKLELHLIDRKIQISVAEARQVFGRNKVALFD